jgi:hypothetical protein
MPVSRIVNAPVLDDKCGSAVRRAIEIAERSLSGDLAEIDAARQIANLASFDCYEFLQEGFELIDLMGEFAAPVYAWDVSEADEQIRMEASQEIQQGLSDFLKRVRSADG